VRGGGNFGQGGRRGLLDTIGEKGGRGGIVSFLEEKGRGVPEKKGKREARGGTGCKRGEGKLPIQEKGDCVAEREQNRKKVVGLKGGKRTGYFLSISEASDDDTGKGELVINRGVSCCQEGGAVKISFFAHKKRGRVP